MDERDCELQGLKIIRRDMAFTKGYVSCENCACNYDMQQPTDGKSFCQIYSMPVDPTDSERCEFMAEACDQWVPRGLDRNMVVTPNHKYRYED